MNITLWALLCVLVSGLGFLIASRKEEASEAAFYKLVGQEVGDNTILVARCYTCDTSKVYSVTVTAGSPKGNAIIKFICPDCGADMARWERVE